LEIKTKGAMKMDFLRKFFGQKEIVRVPQSKGKALSGTFDVVAVCGEGSPLLSDFAEAERKLIKRIVAEHKANIPPGKGRVKTMHGGMLPDRTSESETEIFVRTMQMMLGVGIRDYEVEFREQDGYSFIVIYMR